MKRTALIVATLGLLAGAARAESGADVGIAAEVWMPGAGDYDLYDMGYGAEVSFRRWCNPPFGYEVSAGFGTWEAGDGDQVGSGLTDFDGDAQVLPFGVSGLWQIPETRLTLELGVRYLLMASEIDALNTAAGERTDLEIDDSLLGLVALQSDWDIGGERTLGLDAGYQFDLVSGDIDTDYGSAGETDLQAFFLRVALRWSL